MQPGRSRGGVIASQLQGRHFVRFAIVEIAVTQPHHVTVLADTALRAKDIDEAAALAAKQKAEEALENKEGDITQAEALAELARAAAQLKMLEKLRKIRG